MLAHHCIQALAQLLSDLPTAELSSAQRSTKTENHDFSWLFQSAMQLYYYCTWGNKEEIPLTTDLLVHLQILRRIITFTATNQKGKKKILWNQYEENITPALYPLSQCEWTPVHCQTSAILHKTHKLLSHCRSNHNRSQKQRRNGTQ